MARRGRRRRWAGKLCLLGAVLMVGVGGVGRAEVRPPAFLLAAARPASPAGGRLTVTAGPGEVIVTWSRPPARDVLYFLVYRGEGRDPDLGGDPFEMVKGVRFVDTKVLPGIEYRYAVVPVDRSGVRAPATAVAGARVAAAAGPRITAVSAEPSERALRPGDRVTITITGASGCRATADLGSLIVGLALKETGRTGRYVGVYSVRSKDLGSRPLSHRLVGRLSDANGSSELGGPEVQVLARSEARDVTPPVVARASHDAWKVAGFSGRLVAGDVLTVTAEGEPRATARFEVVGVTGPLPMQEPRPGIFTGSYTVRWGDGAREAHVLVRLSDGGGNETAVQAGRPVALDTRVRLTVSAREPTLPADGRSETRVVAHAANANGDEVSGHEIDLSLVPRGQLPSSGREPVGAPEQGELSMRWGGVTDAFGDAIGRFAAGRVPGDFLVLAKDLTTGDVGIGWVATGERAEAAARVARASRRAESRSRAAVPAFEIATPPGPAEVKSALGTFFVPRLYERQERDRVRISEWLAEPGTTVEKGQALVALETPRGTYKVVAPARGVLQRRARAERDRVGLGDVLGRVEIDPEAWKADYGK